MRRTALTVSILSSMGERVFVPANEVVTRVRGSYGDIHGSQIYRALARLAQKGKVERVVDGRRGCTERTRYRRLPAGRELVMP